MPFCEYCGKPIAEDEICNCKNEVNLSSDHNNYPPPQVTTQKNSGGLWWIWLIIVPVILLMLFIIGILAAIFVPAFIGYNKKSKVTSANANASYVYKAANTALVEFDEELLLHLLQHGIVVLHVQRSQQRLLGHGHAVVQETADMRILREIAVDIVRRFFLRNMQVITE